MKEEHYVSLWVFCISLTVCFCFTQMKACSVEVSKNWTIQSYK